MSAFTKSILNSYMPIASNIALVLDNLLIKALLTYFKSGYSTVNLLAK